VKQVSRARKIFDWIAGVFLVLLGIAGLALPALPGVLFIFGGLAILSSHSVLARRMHEFVKSKARRIRDRISNGE